MDAKEFLGQLLQEDIPSYMQWHDQCMRAKEILSPYDKQVGNHCIEAISSLLPQNAIVAVDIGQNQLWFE